MSKLLLAIIVALLALSTVQAADVAYILNNPNLADNHLIYLLNQLGLSVQKIDNDNAAGTDFSQYKLLLVPDEVYTNDEFIPVNSNPTLILNSAHPDDWNWATRVSTLSSSQPLSAHINNASHFITQGLSGDIVVYNSSIPDYSYLHRFYKAPLLKAIVSTDDDSYLNTFNAVIATADAGTPLRNGAFAEEKAVFFGITERKYWTKDTEKLFKNSVLWIITDFVPPNISNIMVTGITNSSATVQWDTDKLANFTLSYGESNVSLTNSVKSNQKLTHQSTLLSSLKEKTTYYFKIKSCNVDNYCSESSLQSFVTLDLTAPYLTNNQISNITNTSVLISVTLTEPGSAKLFYGSGNFNLETAISSIANSSSFQLTPLTDKTQYGYFAQMCDAALNCRNSSNFSFTTLDITAPKAPANVKIEVMQPNNQVKLSWDLATDDAASYNIYTSFNQNNFDFNTPTASTSNNNYVDVASTISEKKFYIIRAEDGHGNEEANAVVFAKYDILLNDGYNLVTMPLTLQNNSVTAVVPNNGATVITEIKRFEPATQLFETITYSSSWSGAFSSLEQARGYFFKINGQSELTVVGTLPAAVPMDVTQGMNLLGSNSLDNKTVSAIFPQSIANATITEIGIRNADGSYTLSSFTAAWDPELKVLPAQGFWAKSNKNFTLNFNP